MNSVNEYSLSGLENTPELDTAKTLSKGNGRGVSTFYTTFGHIVTKILDMNITFHLPDETEYKPFTTAGEVNTFFHITPDQYGMSPNPRVMDHYVSNIYRTKVAPREQAILDSRRQTIRDFFELNIWGDIQDSDTIDTLLGKIDELAEMGIEDITPYVCNNLKEWIIMNCIGMRKTLDDWKGLKQSERNKNLVEHLEKLKYTDYFIDLVIDLPWRRHPENPYKHMMNNIQGKIHALYRVDGNLEKDLQGAGYNQFRNTRYI